MVEKMGLDNFWNVTGGRRYILSKKENRASEVPRGSGKNERVEGLLKK